MRHAASLEHARSALIYAMKKSRWYQRYSRCAICLLLCAAARYTLGRARHARKKDRQRLPCSSSFSLIMVPLRFASWWPRLQVHGNRRYAIRRWRCHAASLPCFAECRAAPVAARCRRSKCRNFAGVECARQQEAAAYAIFCAYILLR